MDFRPKDNWSIECPHQFQQYVNCNDETAKELAALVYEYATDFETREAIRKGARCFVESDAFISLVTTLAFYDVFPEPAPKGLVLHRYERPPIGKEARDPDAFREYLQETTSDEVQVPCHIPDIIRAFGEFAGRKIDQGIVESCFGFYDDPSCSCLVCGKNWKRTWDE